MVNGWVRALQHGSIRTKHWLTLAGRTQEALRPMTLARGADRVLDRLFETCVCGCARVEGERRGRWHEASASARVQPWGDRKNQSLSGYSGGNGRLQHADGVGPLTRVCAQVIQERLGGIPLKPIRHATRGPDLRYSNVKMHIAQLISNRPESGRGRAEPPRCERRPRPAAIGQPMPSRIASSRASSRFHIVCQGRPYKG